MTLWDLTELSNRLKYKGKKFFNVRYHNWRDGHKPVPKGYVYISVWIHTFNIENGEAMQVESGGLNAIKDIEESSEASQISNFKYILNQLEMHEIEETMTLDGQCIFKPHSFDIRRVVDEEKLLEVA